MREHQNSYQRSILRQRHRYLVRTTFSKCKNIQMAVVVACTELLSKRACVSVYRSRGRYNNHLGIITHDRCSLDMNVN